MQLSDLAPNPKNPRKITPSKLEQLKKALEEFGDLGGFVYNRKTKQIVGGHQRAKVFDAKAKIMITQSYKTPTKAGTVAEGYIELNGERHRYREVVWDETREKAANIAANKGAGEWDFPELGNWFKALSESKFDLELTMFDESEWAPLLGMPVSFEAGTEDDQGKLDEKTPLMVQCPNCAECFDAHENKPQD